jgi:acetyl-CoA carboxylase carboxyl transferase subunit alpha
MKGSMATYALDFEKPLLELETKLAELKRHAATGTASGSFDTLEGEIRRLEKRCARLQQEIFNDLSRWQVVQLSRHPNRPYMLDYVQRPSRTGSAARRPLVRGRPGPDRRLARSDGEPVMVIGSRRAVRPRRTSCAASGCPARRATARRCA